MVVRVVDESLASGVIDCMSRDGLNLATMHAAAASTHVGGPVLDAQTMPMEPSNTSVDFTNTGPVVGPDSRRARLDRAERFNIAHESAP